MEPRGVKVRDLVGAVLFYVGIPAVTLYPLGFVALSVQMWRDPFFPYSYLGTVWDAVSLVPQTVVIGTGVRLLYLALISTAFGVGVATLVVRVFLLLGRQPGEESAVVPGRRGWITYLLVLLPVAAVMLWNSVTLHSWADLVYFIGFLVLSAGGGIMVGYIRWTRHRGHFLTGVVVAYAGSVIAALCLAITQTPQLPLVEIEADRDASHECAEVPATNLFVLLDKTEEYWYVYNKEGLFGLPNADAEAIRFQECQEYLDRD